MITWTHPPSCAPLLGVFTPEPAMLPVSGLHSPSEPQLLPVLAFLKLYTSTHSPCTPGIKYNDQSIELPMPGL